MKLYLTKSYSGGSKSNEIFESIQNICYDKNIELVLPGKQWGSEEIKKLLESDIVFIVPPDNESPFYVGKGQFEIISRAHEALKNVYIIHIRNGVLKSSLVHSIEIFDPEDYKEAYGDCDISSTTTLTEEGFDRLNHQFAKTIPTNSKSSSKYKLPLYCGCILFK